MFTLWESKNTPLGSSIAWLRLFKDGKLIDSLSFNPHCYYEYSIAYNLILFRNDVKDFTWSN